jgi:hypothetical protein
MNLLFSWDHDIFKSDGKIQSSREFFNTIMHEKDDLDRIRDKDVVLVHKKLF